MRSVFIAAAVVLTAAAVIAAAPQRSPAAYAELTSLFAEWRAFQQPRVVDGVPDYSRAAMAAQQRALPAFQQRLAALDSRAWTVPQQVDCYIVRAEMAGMDFDHRVLRPWEKNPAFYVSYYPSRSDQPAREGPVVFGAIELWTYTFPLNDDAAARLDASLRAIPKLLQQARINLTGNARDLWTFGAKRVKQQSTDLKALVTRAANGARAADLQRDARAAADATDAFAAWLDAEAPKKNGPSGVGIDNYDWYLKHVQLAPYTWRDAKALMERELARAATAMAMEEQHNAKLPPQAIMANAAEYDARFDTALSSYMTLLGTMMTVRPDMEPALRARKGRYRPGAPRDFFDEITFRDPIVMRTHDYHWIDLARMANDPHPDPIRRGALLYNIFVTRTEGHATGWEELAMQAGMFDTQPRSRELIYVLLGERAARALGDLHMQSNELSLDQSASMVSANTPRGWLPLTGTTVWEEQHLYMQQPGYGTSYVTGKMQIDALIATRRRQLGDRFSMKALMDDFNAAGLIPASLLRWELTGELPDEVAKMLDVRR